MCVCIYVRCLWAWCGPAHVCVCPLPVGLVRACTCMYVRPLPVGLVRPAYVCVCAEWLKEAEWLVHLNVFLCLRGCTSQSPPGHSLAPIPAPPPLAIPPPPWPFLAHPPGHSSPPAWPFLPPVWPFPPPPWPFLAPHTCLPPPWPAHPPWPPHRYELLQQMIPPGPPTGTSCCIT